jgi:hypothetical protein
MDFTLKEDMKIKKFEDLEVWKDSRELFKKVY